MVGREPWRNKASAGSEQALLWLRYLPSYSLRSRSRGQYVSENAMGIRMSLLRGETLKTTLTPYGQAPVLCIGERSGLNAPEISGVGRPEPAVATLTSGRYLWWILSSR